MIDVAIDIETMGNNKRAAIVSIGAVIVQRPEVKWYRTVTLESSLEAGLEVSASTIRWWMEQEEMARREIIDAQGMPLRKVLGDFRRWLKKHSDDDKRNLYVWSHGSGFDLSILSEAYELAGLGKPPWSYSRERDTRTLFELADVTYPLGVDDGLPKHHALHDASELAKSIAVAFERMGQWAR